jgi:hypothetical protein
MKTLGLITYSKDLCWISALGTRAAVATEARANSAVGIVDNMMAVSVFLFPPDGTKSRRGRVRRDGSKTATSTYLKGNEGNEPYTPNMINSPTSVKHSNICAFAIVARSLPKRSFSTKNSIANST